MLNLESTNKEIARRLLDFLSGVAYANEGKIKKVAISTYIITPYNVDILGDLIDELENTGSISKQQREYHALGVDQEVMEHAHPSGGIRARLSQGVLRRI